MNHYKVRIHILVVAALIEIIIEGISTGIMLHLRVLPLLINEYKLKK